MNERIISENFDEHVKRKFHFLNSVFLGLPLDNKGEGKILMQFKEHVLQSVEKELSSDKIITSFFEKFSEEEIISSLFQIIKYIEREVVLFDSVEDAAFEKINNLNSPNSLENIIASAITNEKTEEILELLKKINIRLVLTAHPTQFYPGAILGIINDLNLAIRENNLTEISKILEQLSFTPFFNKRKPTPYDEALSLIWYLENVFFDAVINIQKIVSQTIPENNSELLNPDMVEMGFWPGGDRDGNPFVTSDITLRVAGRLRFAILRKYYEYILKLKRKLTFRGIYEKLKYAEVELLKSMYSEEKPTISLDDWKSLIREIQNTLITKYNGLYLKEINELMNITSIFGYHFATIDIRQDSSVHKDVLDEILLNINATEYYNSLSQEEKYSYIQSIENFTPLSLSKISEDTINCIKAIKEIQRLNGEKGCNRYIMSNCSSADDIFTVMSLFHLAGWRDKFTIDFIPLFETIKDLENAATIMESLYSNPIYRDHLKNRNNRQTIMLGFSDGTKDGGYFTANWSIYKAKEILSAISRKYGIEVTFFDGRGGPAARGGGKTHNFYTAHGKSIENTRIHLTVQGQTVSSNFGTVMSAQYNIEHLLSASLRNRLYSQYNEDFSEKNRSIMEMLSQESHRTYMELRNDPLFLPYLLNRSAMPFYGEANIGSRPDKRNSRENFTLKDLRAIPFVAAWNLNKQNVPGFYGLGSALEKAIKEGKEEDIRSLYRDSLFFRTLIQNSMMVLKKTNMKVTSHLQEDRKYNNLWKKIKEESEKTEANLLRVSGLSYLMEENPKDCLSVEMRENMILPLCIIQQYGLMKIDHLQDKKSTEEDLNTYKKIVIRASYGIINAGRNTV